MEWDYTDLAHAYLKRPRYSGLLIDDMLARTSTESGSLCCDIGAGVGHLTLMLAERGLVVMAVEPNMAMRGLGVQRTIGFDRISWSNGTGESTGMEGEAFSLVTFGSSFNVTDRTRALIESRRILKRGGWFACLWNYRVLDDPVQAEIEAIIHASIPGYEYGSRRENQTAIIEKSGLFGSVTVLEDSIVHRQPVADIVEAWRSHATLHRQAGSGFVMVIRRIEAYLKGLRAPLIDVPYTTRLWMAQRTA